MAYNIDLSGRIAFVTGASSGLGAQFARTLARAGAGVVLASRRIEKLKELRARIEGEGGDAHVVELDVTDHDSIKAAVAHAETEMGSIDILVNNSGVSTTQRLQDVAPEDYDFVFDTNVKGAFFVAQEVGKRMLARSQGAAPGQLYRWAHHQRCIDGRAQGAAADRGVLHEQGRRGAHDARHGAWSGGKLRHQHQRHLPWLHRHRNQPPPLEHRAGQEAHGHAAAQACGPAAGPGCTASSCWPATRATSSTAPSSRRMTDSRYEDCATRAAQAGA
jgi:NAD(P)-dependent dehydrogenase (short-subunit alcohol dehydrogenase family)